jgi:hypothetical protein
MLPFASSLRWQKRGKKIFSYKKYEILKGEKLPKERRGKNKNKKLEKVGMEAGTQCLGKKPFKERGKISRRTSIGN